MSAYLGEAQLLGWSESHNSGAKLTLALPEPSDLVPFRTMTVKKGKQAGQIIACLMVEINDNEDCLAALQRGLNSGLPMSMRAPKAEEPPAIGPMCRLAAQWCKRADFQDWVYETHRDAWDGITDVPLSGIENLDEHAAKVIRHVCGVESRKELDANLEARAKFNREFRLPFMAVLDRKAA